MKKLTHEQFLDRMKKVHGDKYTVIGTYTLSNIAVEIRHNACGRTWHPKPNVLLQDNTGCPHCNIERARAMFSKTHDQFVSEVRDAVGDEYRVIGTYVNNREKVKIEHAECGHSWQILPNNFLKTNGNRCPKCRTKTSRTAKRIESVIKDCGVTYELEKTFKGCKLQKLLPFDFYLPEYSLLIEYDGEMHDRPWQSKDKKVVERKLKLTRLRDKTKDDFATANGYTLVRIRYDEDLEEVLACLREYLTDKGSTTSRKA